MEAILFYLLQADSLPLAVHIQYPKVFLFYRILGSPLFICPKPKEMVRQG